MVDVSVLPVFGNVVRKSAPAHRHQIDGIMSSFTDVGMHHTVRLRSAITLGKLRLFERPLSHGMDWKPMTGDRSSGLHPYGPTKTRTEKTT